MSHFRLLFVVRHNSLLKREGGRESGLILACGGGAVGLVVRVQGVVFRFLVREMRGPRSEVCRYGEMDRGKHFRGLNYFNKLDRLG